MKPYIRTEKSSNTLSVLLLFWSLYKSYAIANLQ